MPCTYANCAYTTDVEDSLKSAEEITRAQFLLDRDGATFADVLDDPESPFASPGGDMGT